MKKFVTAAAGLLVAASLVVPPAAAQETTQGSQPTNVLGRILDAVLGPDQKQNTAVAEPVALTPIQYALADERRANDRARDQWRHPAETLDFFRVAPGMTVADYMPASGYYTRVLVPYLGETGRYIALNPNPQVTPHESFREYASGLSAKFEKDRAAWNLAGAPVVNLHSGQITDEMNGTVDRVLIFREMHNLHRRGIVHYELGKIRNLLKDDGLLGIVQHRAKPDAIFAYSNGSRGYLRQQDVIDLVEVHGFELVGTSEINANPADPANHEDGVWSLLPVLRGNDESKRAIGESDRMTLLFKKRA